MFRTYIYLCYPVIPCSSCFMNLFLVVGFHIAPCMFVDFVFILVLFVVLMNHILSCCLLACFAFIMANPSHPLNILFLNGI